MSVMGLYPIYRARVDYLIPFPMDVLGLVVGENSLAVDPAQVLGSPII